MLRPNYQGLRYLVLVVNPNLITYLVLFVSQTPVHPMLLFHHHMAALSNYTAAAATASGVTSLPGAESGFRSSTKTGSIADLRLKARQHLASLGI